MRMTTFTSNDRSFQTSANKAEDRSFCACFMSGSAVFIRDAIILASLFVVLLTVALFVRVLMLALFVALAIAVIIISRNNLIKCHRMLEPIS
ncbi:MAG: hypothetical protein ACK5L0_04580 [Candidatus Fimivivens sp.]